LKRRIRERALASIASIAPIAPVASIASIAPIASIMALAPVALALGACFGTTWNPLPPGHSPARDKVALVGTLDIIPPVERNMPGGPRPLMVGPPRDNALAIFTPDRSVPFAQWESMKQKDTVWIPLEGPFVIESPTKGILYLRGIVIATSRGTTAVELDLRIDVQADDRIVYVGHILALRAPPARVEVKDERDEAMEAVTAAGHAELAGQPWITRLAVPMR
jgi:hypothetical protein